MEGMAEFYRELVSVTAAVDPFGIPAREQWTIGEAANS
jgi:hypothetical protein